MGRLALLLLKEKLLIHEARRWVGITEQDGNNRGQLVQLFQKSAGGLAQGEPWCMAFVQYCVQQVDQLVNDCLEPALPKTLLPKGEHCLAVWNQSQNLRLDKPKPGSLCVWQHGNTASGHIGVVVDVNPDRSIMTIEGNTSPGSQGNQREGGGVWLKCRDLNAIGELKVKGFLAVW